MDTCPIIHTPQDVANRLRSKLFPVFQARGVDLQVEIVRDWSSIAPDHVTFEKAFKIRKIKDSGETPDPLLVWPGILQGQSDRLLQVANSTSFLETPKFDDARRDEIRCLMMAMKRDFPDMNRAIAWYQSLLDRDPTQSSERYPTLTFLRNVPDDGPSIHDFQLRDLPPRVQPHNLQVVADKNLGDHLFAVFADHSRMEQAIKFYVSDRFGPIAGKPHANIMPISSLDDFYLGLEKFDFSANGKNGFYPSNCQFQAHFGEFLAYGYKPMESVSVKFNNQARDAKDFCKKVAKNAIAKSKATGRTMDTYVAAHQDKSKNALSKAMEASFVAWGEELKADQAQFCSDCHKRSWDAVSNYLKEKPGAKKEDASDDEAKVKVKEDQGDETDESDGDDERKNAHADLEDMVRKVAGGTDFIQKVVEAMHVPTIKAKIMLDLNAYDGFAALACVEDMCKGNAAVCGSLCLDHSGTDLMSRVSNKVYEHCRSGAISLPGFPDFNPIIHALKSHQPVERQKSFRVSVQQMDRLVVLQSLAQKWLDTESTRERALKIISDHNDTYNCDGQYWLEERREVSASENASRAEEQPRKRIKLEAFSEQDISKLGNVKKFSVNNSLDLILAGQHGDQLFASSRSRNQFFEAEECLQDSEGRWMSFSAKKDTLLILEKKGLPSHIKLENLEVAVTLQSLVCDLQDAGEAKLEVSHHKLKDEDWVSVKPLVFVMDNPPEEGLDCSSGDGTKVLTPIRPVAILGHDLDIGQETVRLM
ncbi:unnamed protein product [Cladocopium goreaui]|uniref:Uncharacterized protein n=1 Tax=Cladocopium goreaui TaxID=2562237 RepID=A0A9P1DDB8_9DINO|nr:unnamed protein product [Cladocopium goreaui]